MPVVYAKPSDLTDGEWLTEVPANAAVLLRAASALVRKATRTWVYPIGDDGLPSDPVIVAAFRDATCAQTVAWTSSGINPTAQGVGVVASKSMGGRSITYAAQDAVARAQLVSNLCDEAVQILTDTGTSYTWAPAWSGVQVIG